MHLISTILTFFRDGFPDSLKNVAVAVNDGCGSVAFVYWLRLKQLVIPMKAQSYYGCEILGAIWDKGMLSSCIYGILVSVCAMKGISIEPLAQ